MKNDILYPYVLIILFFSFISAIPTAFHSDMRLLLGTLVATIIILIFNPVSWAVYYVASTRGVRFKHRDLLMGYEGFLIILSLLAPGIFGPLGFAGSFVLLNLVNPVSWVIIYVSIGKYNPGTSYQGSQRPGAPFASPSAAGSGSPMASPVSSSQQQGNYFGNQNSPQGNFAASSQQVLQQPSQVQRQSPAAAASYSNRERFGDDVTLVGYVGGGKTTFSALFVYACQFIRGIPNFRFVLEETSPLVRSALGQLLSGEWPSLTLRTEYRTQTRIVLSRKKGLSTRKVNLTMNDVSGEIWREVAEQAENPTQKLNQLIRENPSVVSLQRASKYLVTVNCADYGKWDSEQLYILDLFRAIRAINGGKRVKKPTAVIFTKTDLLPAEVQGRDPESILREQLPYVHSYLQEHYDSRYMEYFKVGLRVNEFDKPDVSTVEGKKRLTIIGGGNIGSFPEIVRWMLSE